MFQKVKFLIAFLLTATLLSGTVYAGALSELYPTIKTEFPEIAEKLNKGGATDAQIGAFMDDLEEYILKSGEEITEENYDSIATEAVMKVIRYRSNLPVYNALAKEFTSEALSYTLTGETPQSLMPLYNAVKKYILSADTKSESPSRDPGGRTGGNKGSVPQTDVNTTPPAVPGEGKTGAPPAETEKPHTGFADESEYEWALEAISALMDMKVITGYPDNTFAGNNNITRAEFTKIAVMAFGYYDEEAECSFTDVNEDDWFYPFVASARKHSIVNGYDDSSFRPNEPITRQDIALIVYNAKFQGKAGDAQFADSADVSPYAAEAVSAMKTLGIIKGMGDDMFLPKSFATRAQCAQIIHNAI